MSERFSLRGVYQSFDQAGRQLDVLKGVDLDVGAGETVALLGPSGSGKSCLLHIAGLLEKPTAGEILVNGKVLPIHDDGLRTRGRLQHIGFVYQFHNLLPEFSAVENVMFPLRLRGQGSGSARVAAAELLERLGLSDRLDHLPAQLSGGEQQRVAIARALVTRPDVVLADEPTGSLDGANGAVIADLLLDLARDVHAAVLLATHDTTLAARADRIVALQDGILKQQ